MALNFPNTPEPGDTYIADNGVIYTWDGVKWSGAGVEPGLALPTASDTTAGVVRVDGTTITITNGVISSTGGGGNPFDQELNTNSAVSFSTVAATTATIAQINGTNPGDELVIQTGGEHNWNFGSDGNLTLPQTNFTASPVPTSWPGITFSDGTFQNTAASNNILEIDGGNAYTPPEGELIIDGNGT